MNKNEKKDNVIMLSDFQRNDDYLDDELSNFQKNDDSLDNKEKITAPFAGDSMERFEFLRENFTEVKEIIIKRYLKENNIPTKKLIIDFSFKDNKELFAPALLRGAIFDGYLCHNRQEIFFGVLFNNRIHPSYDKAYYKKLARFHLYNKNNMKNGDFILILADVPNINFKYEDLQHLYLTKRFIKSFEPLIEKKLMMIKKMKFNNNDFNEWYNVIK